jgi:hypothetical protein
MTVWDNVAFGLVERKAQGQIQQKVGARWSWSGLARLRAAPAQPAVGRPAAARGAGAHHRHRTAGAAAGRAAVQPGQDPARADAPGTAGLQRRLGMTTIFVTHDQEEAMTTADRMAVLDRAWCSRSARRPRCTTSRSTPSWRLRGHHEPAAGACAQPRCPRADAGRRRRGRPALARQPEMRHGRCPDTELSPAHPAPGAWTDVARDARFSGCRHGGSRRVPGASSHATGCAWARTACRGGRAGLISGTRSSRASGRWRRSGPPRCRS